jgi:hypothetical protein
LLITQVYIPDPAAAGQHLHDVSRELVSRGKRVVIFTPRGGYDKPSRKYKKQETIDGVEVHRLPMCSFGKNPIAFRLLGGMSLVIQSIFLGLFVKDLTHILVSTAPPMASIAAQFIGVFRLIKIVFWVMDLNPDQIIATGRLKEKSPIARIGHFVNKLILERADKVVVLDSFMEKRLRKNINLDDRLSIIPPWPFENQFSNIDHSENPFRKQHRLEGKFVVMYSGNITPVHPLTTLLDAIYHFKGDSSIIFLFIGSDSARYELNAYAAKNGIDNLKTLPYVPLEQTQYSLSAADLHVITMGNNMVGIVHPCKVYGIMSVGRPFLAIGPKASHIGEIIEKELVGWQVEHGDVNGVVSVIQHASKLEKEKLRRMGNNAQSLVNKYYSRKVLCSKFCEVFQ